MALRSVVLTILLAEDEYSNYVYVKMLLKSDKMKIIHVTNGRDAVEECRKNPAIDLVLMDLKMPSMDGFEATKIIKSKRTDLPVIAITAQVLTGDREKALEAGCNEYIAKPFDKKEQIQLINDYLYNRTNDANSDLLT